MFAGGAPVEPDGRDNTVVLWEPAGVHGGAGWNRCRRYGCEYPGEMDKGLVVGCPMDELLEVGQLIHIFFNDALFETVKLQYDDFRRVIPRYSCIRPINTQRYKDEAYDKGKPNRLRLHPT